MTKRACLLKKVAAMAAATGVVIGLASPVAADALSDLKAKGSATIGMAAEPPWMILEPNGTPTGIGPDIDRAVLETFGVKGATAQVMEYGALIPAVQAKRITFSTGAALYIRPERCRAVAFSDPVVCSGEGLIITSALAGKVKTYADIAKLGLKIGVCAGCSEQKLAVAAGVKDDNITVWPDGTSGMKMLLDKRIDVMGHDAPSALDLQKKLGTAGTQVVFVDNVPLSCSASAFNKEDATLREAYNEGLKKVIASGKYVEILKKYGFENLAPGREGMTTDKHCQP